MKELTRTNIPMVCIWITYTCVYIQYMVNSCWSSESVRFQRGGMKLILNCSNCFKHIRVLVVDVAMHGNHKTHDIGFLGF